VKVVHGNDGVGQQASAGTGVAPAGTVQQAGGSVPNHTTVWTWMTRHRELMDPKIQFES
jgi:hypothetical protein